MRHFLISFTFVLGSISFCSSTTLINETPCATVEFSCDTGGAVGFACGETLEKMLEAAIELDNAMCN